MNYVGLPTLIKEAGKYEERVMTSSCLTPGSKNVKTHIKSVCLLFFFNLNNSLFFKKNLFLKNKTTVLAYFPKQPNDKQPDCK